MPLDDFKNPFDELDESDVTLDTPVAAPVLDPEPKLTDDHKKFLDEQWKEMDLMEMTRHIFKNDNLKGSSKEGRLVAQYLVSKGFKYKTSTPSGRKDMVELTPQHKEFVDKYAATMKPYEIARVVFKDETLHHFSKEALVVQLYIKNTSPNLLKKDDEYTDDEFSPPKTFKAALKRVCEVTSIEIEEETMNVRVRKSIERCVQFLQTPRFVLTVNNLKNISERTIFESEYIRAVWDKPDLTADEVNMYISLMNEYVIQDRLHRIMGKLNMLLENVTADPDGRISIALSDAIKGKSEELHRSLSRQQDFTTDLGGKRSARQDKQKARSKSIVSLVEAFREEQERKNSVRIAEIRKAKVAAEINRLENEDEWEARIFGITKEEILE